MPALAKICQRKEEEAVQETLAIVITKVMPVLGQFTNDKDIKVINTHNSVWMFYGFKYMVI